MKYRFVRPTVLAGRRAPGQWVGGCHPLEDNPQEDGGDFSPLYELLVPAPEPAWIDTGLVTPEGEAIMRPGREPIGFLRFD